MMEAQSQRVPWTQGSDFVLVLQNCSQALILLFIIVMTLEHTATLNIPHSHLFMEGTGIISKSPSRSNCKLTFKSTLIPELLST